MMRRATGAAKTNLLLAAVRVSWCLLLLSGVRPVSAADSSSKQRAAPVADFFEPFEPGWTSRWHYATAKKYKGRFEVVKPAGFQDTAIKVPKANEFYGLAARLDTPLMPSDGLVVQYEVKFSEGHKCGGAYLKLLSVPSSAASSAAADGGGKQQQQQQQQEVLVPEKLKAKTPFSIMFGPDRCGPDARVHVILHLFNPATGNTTEHHLMSAPKPKEDLLSHVYALLLHKNGRYKVLIDGLEAAAGALLDADFSPPLQPPEFIPDPEDVKPEDWVEEEKMDDPRAEKPEGWDNRRMVSDPHVKKPQGWLDDEEPDIPDPTAVKPDSWDEATQGLWLPPPIKNPKCVGVPGCGPWKAPLVKNPKYKGPWIPPQVKNPAYKGPWEQRQIPNPAYHQVDDPLALLPPIGGVAFELWTTDVGYTFDSVLLGSGDGGIAAAAAYMRDTWRPRNNAEKAAYIAAERANSRPGGVWWAASNALRDVLDSQALAGVRPKLGRLSWLLQEHAALGWVILLAPPIMTVALVMDRITKAKQKAEDAAQGLSDDEDNAGGGGLADKPEPELEVDEEEVKRLSKQAAALQKQRAAQQQQPQQQSSSKKGAAAGGRQKQQQSVDEGGSASSEEEEGDEDTQQEQQPAAAATAPTVRRRAVSRRA